MTIFGDKFFVIFNNPFLLSMRNYIERHLSEIEIYELRSYVSRKY